jgi:hypothetical protein
MEFEKLLKAKQQELINKSKNHTLLNLTPLQRSALTKLRQNNNFIIKPTDKNLGPAVMDASTYVKQVLQIDKKLFTTIKRQGAPPL